MSWPDPTPEMLAGHEQFDAIWNCIKTWDINVPGAYSGYCGATGNHARAILDALNAKRLAAVKRIQGLVEKAADKWNGDQEYIQSQIAKMKAEGRKGRGYDDPEFVWGQIVRQECRMYAQLGAQVNLQEFRWLIKDLGFDDAQIEYLRDTINHLQLGWEETETPDIDPFKKKLREVEKEISYESKA
jgi:hypothetical protein